MPPLSDVTTINHWPSRVDCLSLVTRCWAHDGVISSPQQSHRGTCPKGAGCQDIMTKQQSVLLQKSSLSTQLQESYLSISKLMHDHDRLRWEKRIRDTLRCTHRGTVGLEWSQTIYHVQTTSFLRILINIHLIPVYYW